SSDLVWPEVAPEWFRPGEGDGARPVLDDEVEGVDRRQVRDEVDRELQVVARPGEEESGRPAPEGVLVPRDVVLARVDGQRVPGDRGGGGRRRARPDRVRGDGHRAGEAGRRAGPD